MHPLERIIRHFKLDWMIDAYAPPEAAVPALLRALEAANDESSTRYGPGVLPLTVDTLQNELEPHPYRVEALLQAMAATSNPTMLVMAWSILSGGEVARVSLNYDYCNTFSFEVLLREDTDGKEQSFRSDDIADAALFRHLGIAMKGRKPFFDGFYALHLSRETGS